MAVGHDCCIGAGAAAGAPRPHAPRPGGPAGAGAGAAWRRGDERRRCWRARATIWSKVSSPTARLHIVSRKSFIGTFDAKSPSTCAFAFAAFARSGPPRPLWPPLCVHACSSAPYE